MRWAGVMSAVVSCAVVTGCTGFQALPADRDSDGSADWRPPAGAPEFCSVLADAESVEEVPDAVGALLADPTDPEPAFLLAQSAADLRSALVAVRETDGYAELQASLDELVDALSAASVGPRGEWSEPIADGLTTVGRLAQPVCAFPA